MSHILIDGRFIGVGDSISRYTLEITKGILTIDSENQYTLLIRPEGIKTLEEFFKSDLPTGGRDSHNLKIQVMDIPHYSLAEQIKLLRYLNREKFDLVHFTQFNHPVMYRGKFVITIHDLTLIGHLHRQSATTRYAFSRVMISAVNNSQKILTVSKTSKKEIADYYNLSKNKIVVTYNGIDPKYNYQVKSQPACRTGRKSKVESRKQ